MHAESCFCPENCIETRCVWKLAVEVVVAVAVAVAAAVEQGTWSMHTNGVVVPCVMRGVIPYGTREGTGLATVGCHRSGEV